MMKAFEDHPEVKKAGEYRGLEFTKAVEDFLAADDFNEKAVRQRKRIYRLARLSKF